jgi:AcrR family transcriptional regulator
MDNVGSSWSGDSGDFKAKMVAGAVRLLATRGLEGTSFAEVLDITGAPRGSVYHYFPGGKLELMHAALDLASGRALAEMEVVRGKPPADVVARFLALWRILLERSNVTAGCAVLAVTVATNNDDVLSHAGDIFSQWTDLLANLCEIGGMGEEYSRQLAITVIAATEGAVAICRAERSMQAFDDVELTLLSLVTSYSNQTRSSLRKKGRGSKKAE